MGGDVGVLGSGDVTPLQSASLEGHLDTLDVQPVEIPARESGVVSRLRSNTNYSWSVSLVSATRITVLLEHGTNFVAPNDNI